VKLIKSVLYDQGYTIAGAKKKLVRLSDAPEQLSLPLKNRSKALKEIKVELQKINDILSQG
jgi:hypothetical protein